MARSSMMRLFVLILLLAAGAAFAARPAFVDLDGDGFDDNLPDIDGNGIPEWSASGSSEAPATGDISPHGNVISLDQIATAPVVSRVERFEQRLFKARLLKSCRSDFDARFGNGPGVSLGSAAGGACAGGVCVPHSLF